jgi:hypothetical protein
LHNQKNDQQIECTPHIACRQTTLTLQAQLAIHIKHGYANVSKRFNVLGDATMNNICLKRGSAAAQHID